MKNYQTYPLIIIRIITGLLVTYHGLEVFDLSKMNEYQAWDSIKALPAPKAMVYIGKWTELAAGLALALGAFTRIASAAIMAVMLFICFYLGKGRFWYEDQHPFLLAMLAALYLFSGAIGFSADQKIFSKK